MQLFKTKYFTKWANAHQINDLSLKVLLEELIHSNTASNLGGGLYKQRIARQGQGQGQGKSKSYRTIIAFKKKKHVFFIYGFAKNDQANLSRLELKTFKQLANDLWLLDNQAIQLALSKQELIEVNANEKE